MTCNDVRQHWMLYLDSEGDPELHFHISDHLGMCPECAEWFARQERFERLVTEHLRDGPADEELWSRVLRRGGLVQGRLAGRRQWLVWGRGRALAAIGLAAAVVTLLVVLRSTPQSAAANDLTRLTVDCHERHLRGLSSVEFLSQDDRAITRYLRQHVSFPVNEPPKEKGFSVQGAGVCHWARTPVAYMAGRVQEEPVSIFVLARDSLDTFSHMRDRLLEEGGRYRCRERNYQMVSAMTPENVVVVVGSAAPGTLEQLLNAYVGSPTEVR